MKDPYNKISFNKSINDVRSLVYLNDEIKEKSKHKNIEY